MSPQRHLHLNLESSELNLHQGVFGYERDHGGGPDRSSAFAPQLEMVKLAEEGFFTTIFVGDIAGSIGSPAPDGGPPDPLTKVTALVRESNHVGFIATASTSFYDPYNLARLIGSIDQVSDGRIGFNAVTSANDAWALNYSRTHPDRETRYQIADEFLEVVTRLWDNRELRTGTDGITRFFSSPIDHQGKNFQVLGPLNVAPSRQGRPMIAQAGGSLPGLKVAAKYAEMVFTNANTPDQAGAHRANLNEALLEAGRPENSVPVFPGVVPYLGRTAKEAQDRLHDLDDYVDYDAIAPYSLSEFGIEFSYNSLDDPFPVEVLPDPAEAKNLNTIKGVFANYQGIYTWISERPGVTVREVAAHSIAHGGSQHRKFVGSYDDFVNDLTAWFEGGHADGFNVMFPLGCIGIREFVEECVPRLIDRGIYRDSPDTRPLRDRFGNGPPP